MPLSRVSRNYGKPPQARPWALLILFEKDIVATIDALELALRQLFSALYVLARATNGDSAADLAAWSERDAKLNELQADLDARLNARSSGIKPPGKVKRAWRWLRRLGRKTGPGSAPAGATPPS